MIDHRKRFDGEMITLMNSKPVYFSDDRSTEKSAGQKSDHLKKLFPMIDHRNVKLIQMSDHLLTKLIQMSDHLPTKLIQMSDHLPARRCPWMSFH